MIRENKVVCIKKEADTDRSMGVNRILVNYHILSTEAQARVDANPDQGMQRSTEAWRHVVDAPTREANRVETLSTNSYEYYEASINAVTEFSKLGLMPIGSPEFMLGSRNLIVRETPTSSVWVFLVGAIDLFLYNKNTGRLVIAESKSSRDNDNSNADQGSRYGGGGGGGGNAARFLTMEQLYMKEKHCMQVTMYAVMLISMSREAGVPINPDDIELVLFASNFAKRKSMVWSLKYRPLTFLGRNWAPNRWHGLLDTGCLKFLYQTESVPKPKKRLTLPPVKKCCFCGGTKQLGETRSEPVQIVCTTCFETRKCDCGRLLRSATRKYCGPDCPNLKTGVVHQFDPSGKPLVRCIKN